MEPGLIYFTILFFVPPLAASIVAACIVIEFAKYVRGKLLERRIRRAGVAVAERKA